MATDLIMPAPAMADQSAAGFYHHAHHNPAYTYGPPAATTAQVHAPQQQFPPSLVAGASSTSSPFAPPPDRPHHQRSQSYQQQPVTSTPSYTPTQISPLSTSQNASGPNSSPTSPKSYHARQLRPMYMPAVLRPTEFPSKLPPKGVQPDARPENSVEGEDEDDKSLLRRSNSSFLSLTGLTVFGTKLSRRSTNDSGKCLGGDWDLDLFPKVTGEPTRRHWKADPESTVCDDPTCKRKFNYFIRRHHCRKCGNIFCDTHTPFGIPLDQDANYHPRGLTSRSCTHCYQDFKAWRSRNNSQTGSSVTSSDATNPNATPASPIAAGAPGMGIKGPDAAASIPRDWNWSTF